MNWGSVQGAGRNIDPTHWSYSGDPASSTKDRVRFLIGDVVKEDPLVTDPEINAALDDHGDNPRLAAADCCDFLAGYFAREADVSGDNGKALSQRAEAYTKRAAELRASSSSKLLLSAMPYCGGISISDKESELADGDRPKSAFTMDTFGANDEDQDAPGC